MRHTRRDSDGTAVLCTTNIQEAVEVLARFEEAAEAVDLNGPGQVRAILQHAKEDLGAAIWKRWKETAPPSITRRSMRQKGMKCRNCGHYRKKPRHKKGLCDIKDRRILRDGVYTTVTGKRSVSGSCPCCGDFVPLDYQGAADESVEVNFMTGETCCCLREWLKLTHEAVAEECGISVEHLRKIETTDIRPDLAEWLLRHLCKMAGWSFDLLKSMLEKKEPARNADA